MCNNKLCVTCAIYPTTLAELAEYRCIPKKINVREEYTSGLRK